MSEYLDLLEDELREAVERQAGLASGQSRRSGRSRRAAPRLSWLVPVAAAIVALVVAGGALLLVRHGRPGAATHPSAPAVRGQILDSTGGILVRGVPGHHQYPDGDLAAQVLGVNGPDGRSGLEAGYADVLQRGENLETSIDARLQRVGQRALARSIAENGTDRDIDGGGAFVAMDPQNGQIYAMGSAPTFDPNEVTAANARSQYRRLNSPRRGYPLLDRAIDSAGPTGSTFKVITATAALESGNWLVNQTYDDTGEFCFPGDATDCLHNSGHAAYGVVNLVSAIKVSDDNFFYNLGYRLNSDAARGGPLQRWARRLGIGVKTGVDLPGELAGTLPTPAWRAHQNELERECDQATGPYAGQPKHRPGGCGIAVYPFESWTAGDNVNTAVGEGDDQVTPLQLAVVYSAIENGGTIVTPHVGEDIQSADGNVIERIDPAPKRRLHIQAAYLDAIRTGLRQAAGSRGGTSYDVMGHFPEPVHGVTGTAQFISAKGVEQDTAWYACYVPATATSKPIVVIVTVAQGGFGDVAAAPVARQILSEWFLGHPGPFRDGVVTGDGL